MAIPVYIRKEYFRAVSLKENSAHILEFHYRPKTVEVYEQGLSVFHMEYLLETKTKVRIAEYYLTDFSLRGKGYGATCMNEILSQFEKRGITLVTAPLGYNLAPLGYTGPDQYKELMRGFYRKTDFSINGDVDMAMKILG